MSELLSKKKGNRGNWWVLFNIEDFQLLQALVGISQKQLHNALLYTIVLLVLGTATRYRYCFFNCVLAMYIRSSIDHAPSIGRSNSIQFMISRDRSIQGFIYIIHPWIDHTRSIIMLRINWRPWMNQAWARILINSLCMDLSASIHRNYFELHTCFFIN